MMVKLIIEFCGRRGGGCCSFISNGLKAAFKLLEAVILRLYKKVILIYGFSEKHRLYFVLLH